MASDSTPEGREYVNRPIWVHGDVTVSLQKLKQSYWISNSFSRDVHPHQERLSQFSKYSQVTKPYFVSYDLPVRERFWVDTQHHHFVFSDREKAICWAAIMYKTGIRNMEANSEVVPIEVATLGAAYLAAYLFAVHNYSYSDITEKLDITRQSLYQYLSDVRNLNR